VNATKKISVAGRRRLFSLERKLRGRKEMKTRKPYIKKPVKGKIWPIAKGAKKKECRRKSKIHLLHLKGDTERITSQTEKKVTDEGGKDKNQKHRAGLETIVGI